MSRMDGFAENLTDVVRERYEFGCKFIAGFFRGGDGGGERIMTPCSPVLIKTVQIRGQVDKFVYEF